MSYQKKQQVNVSKVLRFSLPIVCTTSLILYLVFSKGLCYLLSGWEYHLQLVKVVFPNGILNDLRLHIPYIPIIPTTHEGFLFAAFILICIASAWLVHILTRSDRSEIVPHLILFSLAIAIIPTLILATVFWSDGRGKLTLDMMLCSSVFIWVALVGLNITFYQRKSSNIPAEKKVRKDKLRWGWFFLLPLLIVYGLAYLKGSIAISGYDSLSYHLPNAATWLKKATIHRCFDIQCFYPGNAELIMRWGFIDNSEAYIFLIPFISGILCIYIVYKLCREIGQGKDSAFVAACCVSSIPMLPFLSTTSYTDIFGTFLSLLSVFFIIRWIKSNLLSISTLISAGLAAGLAAGTKFSTLPHALILLVVVIFVLFKSDQAWKNTGTNVEEAKLNWSWTGTQVIAFFSAALIGGGYWYLRNLTEFKNPFYPVRVFGFPGLNLSDILPVHAVFVNSPWSRFLYPWTELSYSSVFDDGIGATATALVIPALIFWPIIYKKTREAKLTGPGIVYFITLASLIMFVWSGTTTMRYGIFAIIISFVFIGEIWKRAPSVFLKLVTLCAYLIMSAAISQSLAGGFIYEASRSHESRADKFNIPEIVDHLPATRIFNAVDSSYTYGLMGRDHRHEVVSLFRVATPKDVISFKATHLLLKKSQEDIYKSKIILEKVGEEPTGIKAGVTPVSLWKVIKAPHQ